jgi:hypothetical protein
VDISTSAPVKNGYIWIGAMMNFAGPVSLSVIAVRLVLNNIFQDGILGAARVCRADQLATGQTLMVTGKIQCELVPNGNIAPYTDSDKHYTLTPSILQYSAALYNGATEFFKRIWKGQWYSEVIGGRYLEHLRELAEKQRKVRRLTV